MTRTGGLFYFLMISVLLSLLISRPALADDRDAEYLTKEDMDSFEKLIFYPNGSSNMIDCDQGGVSTSSVSGYEWLPAHVLMPTDSGNVRVEYGRIGQYKGREISAIVNYFRFEKKANTAYFKQRDGRYLAIPYNFSNYCFYDGDSLHENVVFYYSDDPEKKAIDVTNAYLVVNELNIDEYAGAAGGQKIYVSEDTKLTRKDVGDIVCYGNGVLSRDDYSLVNADNYKYKDSEGTYYEDKPDNKYYHMDSVLFRLEGGDNEFYIEDKRQEGGFGIKWALELNTLNIRYRIDTHVEHGSITPSMNGIKYDSEKTVEFHPDEYYELESITVDGEEKDISGDPTAYTFNHIFEDHDISVVYRPPYRSVTTEVENGSITEGNDKVPMWSDMKIGYSPNEGYLLDSITVDGTPVDPTGHLSEYLFENIQTDHTIRVVYSRPEEPVKTVTDRARKDINGRFVKPGDILEYHIAYKNPLKRKAKITIKDTIPEHTELYAAEGGTVSGNTVTWSKEADPGTGGSVTMAVRVSTGTKGETVRNYAIQIMDDVKSISNTVTNPVPCDPVKTVTDTSGKDIDRKILTVGQEVIYSITVRNNAEKETDCVIKDKVPAGMEYISADNSAEYSKGEITWNIKIPAGEEKKVSFRARTTSEGAVCINRASVVYEGIESDTNKVENWVMEKPKKEVRQNGVSVDGRNLSGGETVEYRITVKNPAAVPADIRITDVLSEYLEVKSISDGGRTENGTLIWELSDVRAKETVAVSFTASVKGGDEARKIVNNAKVSIDGLDQMTNDTTIYVPPIKTLRILGEKKSPEPVSVNKNTGVLGERKVATGDRSYILVFILLAMCALAGIEVIKVKRTYDD